MPNLHSLRFGDKSVTALDQALAAVQGVPLEVAAAADDEDVAAAHYKGVAAAHNKGVASVHDEGVPAAADEGVPAAGPALKEDVPRQHMVLQFDMTRASVNPWKDDPVCNHYQNRQVSSFEDYKSAVQA